MPLLVDGPHQAQCLPWKTFYQWWYIALFWHPQYQTSEAFHLGYDLHWIAITKLVKSFIVFIETFRFFLEPFYLNKMKQWIILLVYILLRFRIVVICSIPVRNTPLGQYLPFSGHLGPL